MNNTSVLRAFGFDFPESTPPASIYPYAPVFHLSNAGGEWIVKRTQQPLAQANAVAAWTRALSAGGIPVVTPADGFGENPRSFQSEAGGVEIWVVYPFIRGQAYSGEIAEIRAAGELLGSIHACGKDADFGLKVSETVVAIGEEEVRADSAGILKFVERFFPQSFDQARRTLTVRIDDYLRRALPELLALRLPLANCTWDYKASNLIYQDGSLPVLVDPDNAGRIPRTYDLAIAALLFHNEGVGPARVFNRAEWLAFLDGYSRKSQLGQEERAHWEDLLLCAWIDEALWLLNGEEADWTHPQQSRLLASLLATDLSTFALP
jgi:spectinomycin phosphotransferase